MSQALQSSDPLKWVQDHYADLGVNGINANDLIKDLQGVLNVMQSRNLGSNFMNPFLNPNIQGL